jgi:hypothetical protein
VRKDQNLPQQRILGRPFCEVCKAQMWLACIEPDKPDYDKRTFECPVCPNITVKVVKYRTSHTPLIDIRPIRVSFSTTESAFLLFDSDLS